ncbi:energy-coupled thiamine transporter ThiT [Lacticigenium naphthae]|uniref:energy-coupled thiamine transporter ThiT n=1 Tax=Lacticigenium naphthae TaxID=515351 RepID=UPI0003F679B6|nr:energy-coupled thiamine transporter ThiT [Lacticigenium naphthae]
MKNKLTVWIEGTIIAALAIGLSLLPTNIGPSITISLGMIPLTLYSLRRGFVPGVFAGFLWGILHFLIGNAVILTFWQGFIEYVIAFAFAGFAGLFSNRQLKSNSGRTVNHLIIITLASFVGVLARFFWHFIAGIIFWGNYAPEGMSPVWYSFVMNGVSGLATFIATATVLLLIYKTNRSIFGIGI